VQVLLWVVDYRLRAKIAAEALEGLEGVWEETSIDILSW
jgi:hypothetical protein